MLQTLEPTLSQLLHCLSFLLHLQSFGKRYLPSVYTPHFLQTNWVPAVWHLPLWSSEIALTKGINTSISLNPDDAFQVLTLLYMPSFLRAFLVLSQLWPGCLPSPPLPRATEHSGKLAPRMLKEVSWGSTPFHTCPWRQSQSEGRSSRHTSVSGHYVCLMNKSEVESKEWGSA